MTQPKPRFQISRQIGVISLAICLFASSFSTRAETDRREKGFYLGFGGMLINVDAVDISLNEVEFKAAELHAGYRFNNFASLELRGGANLIEEVILLSEEINAGTAEVSIERFFTAYYRIEAANEIAKIYGLFGGSQVSTHAFEEDDPVGTAVNRSASGFSYGIGVGFIVGQQMNLNFEWRSLIDSESDLFVSFGSNLEYHF